MKNTIIKKFLLEIRTKFPEVSVRLDEWMRVEGYEPEDRMYAATMEQFSQITTDAFKNSDEEKPKVYLEYISQKLLHADEIEREYIDTYYIESLMWNDSDKARRKKCWELMPENLQTLYFDFWGIKL